MNRWDTPVQSFVRLEQHELQPGVVTALFQPIVTLGTNGHSMVAVEALARGHARSSLESPLALFAAARQAGLLVQLDRLCIQTALEAARELPRHLLVFLNVHPATLCEDFGFPAFVADTAARCGLEPSRLTLELLEHSRVTQSHCPQLRASIHVMRGYGMHLAVDDVGNAPEDVRRAMALGPDYLKVDADMVRSAETACRSRAQLHALADEALRKGARVIAEGIEHPRDLEVAAAAGISLAQGYLLGRPLSAEILNRFLPGPENSD